MPSRDSLDKILTVYIASVCVETFSYRGVRYGPRPLVVSPLLFRAHTCPAACGGCCPRFSLDYLPGDPTPDRDLKPRFVAVNGRPSMILSDQQKDHAAHFCRELDPTTGRCGIYERRPFSCDFELLRFIRYSDRTVLMSRWFNRGWAMTRVDGGRGAKCAMLPVSADVVPDVARKLSRLHEWADHFGIATCLPTVLDWVRRGPHASALRLSP